MQIAHINMLDATLRNADNNEIAHLTQLWKKASFAASEAEIEQNIRVKLDAILRKADNNEAAKEEKKAATVKPVVRLTEWAQMFRELEVYVAMRGHLWDGNVPAAYKMTSKFSDTLGKEIKLGSWVRTQKLTLKSGKLDEKLKGRLERIGLKLSIRLRG